MNLMLTPGTVCAANGRVIEIDGRDSLSHMRARDVATGQMVSIPIARIEALPDQVKNTEAGFVPEAEWKRSVALAKDLQLWNHRQKVPAAEMRKVAARHGLSLRQLQRMRARFQADPRTSSLVREPGGRPAGLNCLDDKVDVLIKHTIRKHFFKRERPPKEEIVERVRSLARRLKLTPPSRNAVLLRIDRELGYAADIARLGLKAAKQKWEARTGQLYVDGALELMEIDHTPADVIIVSDDRLTVRGRPWVTLAIDVGTRCVAGMYVGMEAPSSVSVALCIEHAVLPKPENHDQPGLWPMYGKPKRILVDNGKDFHAYALKRGCEQHHIELSWRPVRTPHYGAHIERLIGTLMKIAHLLPGTTFSNVKERGDYDSEGKARLTLDEFRAWLAQKICRYYHVRRHSSLGAAPLVSWERAWVDEAGKPTTPALLARPTEFRLDFLPYQIRKVKRTGITLDATRYWHDDLNPVLRQDVMVRFDPRDPSKVWVRRDDGMVVTAAAVAGRGAGQPSTRLAVDEATRERLDAELDAGFEATDDIESTAIKATERARRQAKAAPKKEAAAKPELVPDTAPLPMVPPGRETSPIEVWN
jgi:putative transposase